MMNPLISNPEINSSQDEFINKWLETMNPTSFSCSIDYSSIIKEPDYLEKGGELDFPEDFEILFWIRNEEEEAIISIPLDGIYSPIIRFYKKGISELYFNGDVSICEPLLKLIKKQEQN